MSIKSVLLVVVFAIILSGCGNNIDVATLSNTTSQRSNSDNETKALPFSIETVETVPLSGDASKDISLKLARINVTVLGGIASEWAATAAVIAEKVSEFGADMVEVYVNRSDIFQTQGKHFPIGNDFRQLAHAYYSPDPARTIWDGGKPMQIYVADSAHLATQQDLSIYNEFEDLNQKFIDKGTSFDEADKKSGAIVAKRYGLAKDWPLPMGNLIHEFDRNSIKINVIPAIDSLSLLDQCMSGKMNSIDIIC